MHYQSLKLKRYVEQLVHWPHEGKHILAQYDHDSIIVYQAYRPAIGQFAVEHQYFGGEFSFNRMSWIKPNFLWMMYRSHWGQSPGQEVVLAVRLKRAFFDNIVKIAVPSSYDPARYANNDAWRQTVETSNVRLQWDPDHDPIGNPCNRRAIQLGLRGDILRQYSKDAIIEIIDVSELVAEQRNRLSLSTEQLLTPEEHVYGPPTDNPNTYPGPA